jgi:hypothetical protein
MSDDAERIRRQMQAIRQDMEGGVKDVVDGAKQLSDWRYHVRRHPWACVGGAMALGFLLVPMRSRKKVEGIPAELLAQLRAGGAMPAAAAAGGAGLAATVARMAAPIVLRGVSSFVAGKFASRRAHREALDPNGVAP